jgi:hypothetical protein
VSGTLHDRPEATSIALACVLRRNKYVFAAISGCIIVLGDTLDSSSVEVYEEALGRWTKLPCANPLYDGE